MLEVSLFLIKSSFSLWSLSFISSNTLSSNCAFLCLASHAYLLNYSIKSQKWGLKVFDSLLFLHDSFSTFLPIGLLEVLGESKLQTFGHWLESREMGVSWFGEELDEWFAGNWQLHLVWCSTKHCKLPRLIPLCRLLNVLQFYFGKNNVLKKQFHKRTKIFKMFKMSKIGISLEDKRAVR